MNPGIYNIKARQGATFRLALNWKPGGVLADLTGYTGRMQVRRTVDNAAVLLDLQSPASGLVLGGAGWNVVATASAAAMAALKPGAAVYDLELTAPDGTVLPVLAGRFDIAAEVTR